MRYCTDDEGQEDCLPCPQYATCVNNTLSCDMGYKAFNYTCVEDEAITNEARTLLQKVKENLSYLSGEFQCGQSEIDYITLPEIKKDIWEAFPDKANLLIAKINNLTHELNFDVEGDKLRSKTAYLSLKCRFKMFLREYIFGIIVTTVVVVFILLKIR